MPVLPEVGSMMTESGFRMPLASRPGGVQIFQLGQHPGFQPQDGFDVGQFQQRGVPNELVGGCVDMGHGGYLRDLVWKAGMNPQRFDMVSLIILHPERFVKEGKFVVK